MPEKADQSVLRRKLTMPGLKPTDFFLFAQAKKHFDMTMRQVFVLGIRLIYTCFADPLLRDRVLYLAHQVQYDNLDKDEVYLQYRTYDQLLTDQPSLNGTTQRP